MKSTRFAYVILVLALAFIALDKVLLMLSMESMVSAWPMLMAEFVMQTLCYAIAIWINFSVLLPRMLYRGRLVSYVAFLTGFAILFTAVEVLCELFITRHYHLQHDYLGYFSAESILVFEVLSTVVAYVISLAGSGFIIFVQQWRQSGQMVDKLEQQNAKTELAREKSKIDLQAMFRALDSVAAVIRTAPLEAVERLVELSKSLREQLYRSDHYKGSPLEAPSGKRQQFSISRGTVDWLTARRYHPLRLLSLFALLVIIGSSNIDGSLLSVVVSVATASVMFGFLCLNVYVLTPKYLLQNNLKTYFVWLVALISAAIIIMLGLSCNTLPTIPLITLLFFVLTNLVKFVFLFCGTTVFVLFQNWLRNEQRISQLETATLRSELEQLQNQVNPHFLFNMLNNIIVLTKENPEEAAITLKKLIEMLRYQFDEFGKQHIRLKDDIRFLTDYLHLEQLRRDHFEFDITVEEGLDDLELPPMLFIPFVENAVKHNNDNRNLSYVRLWFGRTDTDGLHFTCINSKPQRVQRKDEVGGLGLVNIRRRLELLYGMSYQLKIADSEKEFSVQLIINSI